MNLGYDNVCILLNPYNNSIMEYSFLRGKSILLTCPETFGYGIAVKEKLIQMGAYVSLFDERPGNGLLAKGLIRINKDLIKTEISKHYDQIAKEIEGKEFDIILMLNPEALPISFIQMCKSRWGSALYVTFLWDSVTNRPRSIEYAPFCDRTFIFDRDDAKSNNFNFKSLFYLDVYSSVRQNPQPIDYDLCFIATLHSDRYAIAKEVKNWCDRQGLRSFFYFFMQNRVLYYFNKVQGKGVTAPLSEVSFTTMSTAEIVQIVASSKVVLDIQHPKQNGLTMRTIESIGSGKKLITTNSKIKDYDFYNPENITVIDRSNPTEVLDLNFFLNDPFAVPEEILESYSIGGWLTDILRT
jgi:hypothetical protein